MSFLDLFGGQPFRRSGPRQREKAARGPVINRPPRDAALHAIRPRRSMARRAWRADRDGALMTPAGPLRFRAGQDWIVEDQEGEYAVVRQDIFERAYRRTATGAYERRDDVQLHYFTLPYPARVRTLAGVENAAPGDWIIRGVTGELWCVRPDVAQRLYAS